jgi:putative heme-binding domain-containing protein
VHQQRASADGERDAVFWSSLPRGEQRTGSLRSEPFDVPGILSFYLAGHSGPPEQPPHSQNVIRLCDAVSGDVLMESLPPRDDTAQRVEWDLSRYQGQRAYVEVVDGDANAAYAWLAVGRFSLDALSVVSFVPLRAAADVIARAKIHDLQPELRKRLATRTLDLATERSISQSLLQLQPDVRLAALVGLIDDPETPGVLRGQIIHCVTDRQTASTDKVLVDAMRSVSAQTQNHVAHALAGEAQGAMELIGLIETGHASPRLLLDSKLKEKLLASRLPDAEARIGKLTAGLPSVEEGIARRIQQLQATYNAKKASEENGARVFVKQCAACHRIGGQGALVGPQLDGIGNRDLARLLEDLLDPNRNIDEAFRSTIISTEEGQIISGLELRTDGDILVMADAEGKDIRVPLAQIEQRRRSPVSPMPGNLSERVSDAELHDLLRYLLAQQSAGPAPPSN